MSKEAAQQSDSDAASVPEMISDEPLTGGSAVSKRKSGSTAKKQSTTSSAAAKDFDMFDDVVGPDVLASSAKRRRHGTYIHDDSALAALMNFCRSVARLADVFW